MSNILINEKVELNVRKEQALQLDIDLKNDMSQEKIEEEIVLKLESGMKDLKEILEQINLLD